MDEDWTDLDSARTFAWVRILLGALLFFAPRTAAKLWTGEDTRDVTAGLAVRGMGARDAALGACLLIALERGAPVRGWLEAGAVVDASDAFGTLAAWGDLPKWRAVLLLASEAGSAYLGSQLAQSLD